MIDVVRLGGKLYALSPVVPDPTEERTELEVSGASTLKVGRTIGYGAPGEELHFQFGDDGRVESVRGPGGMTRYPFEAYVAAAARTQRVTPDAPLRRVAGDGPDGHR